MEWCSAVKLITTAMVDCDYGCGCSCVQNSALNCVHDLVQSFVLGHVHEEWEAALKWTEECWWNSASLHKTWQWDQQCLCWTMERKPGPGRTLALDWFVEGGSSSALLWKQVQTWRHWCSSTTWKASSSQEHQPWPRSGPRERVFLSHTPTQPGCQWCCRGAHCEGWGRWW